MFQKHPHMLYVSMHPLCTISMALMLEPSIYNKQVKHMVNKSVVFDNNKAHMNWLYKPLCLLLNVSTHIFN